MKSWKLIDFRFNYKLMKIADLAVFLERIAWEISRMRQINNFFEELKLVDPGEKQNSPSPYGWD